MHINVRMVLYNFNAFCDILIYCACACMGIIRSNIKSYSLFSLCSCCRNIYCICNSKIYIILANFWIRNVRSIIGNIKTIKSIGIKCYGNNFKKCGIRCFIRIKSYIINVKSWIVFSKIRRYNKIYSIRTIFIK